MKHFKSLVLFIGVLACCSIVYADGILRVPQENGDDILCPLEGVTVAVEIHEQVAITTVRNCFVNQTGEFIRAIFHYRLPVAASVSGFGIWRGGELLEYELRPGEQGGPGGGAADNPDIEEFLGDNPFSIPIDSIAPGSFMLQLRYVELLPYDFGVVGMSYPLNCDVFLSGDIATVSISVAIDAQRGIEALEVTTYQDNTEIEQENEHQAHVTMQAEGLRPEEDWNLAITFDQEDIGAWIYAHRSNLEEPGYFILVIEPGIVDTSEQVQKYFTFVMDRSGSMTGAKIVQSKQALLNCMNHLLPIDYFNIIDFASDVQFFSDEMLVANANNITSARNYVNRIEANGSTNIYEALMTAISQVMGENAANQVVFTTDGQPTAGPTDPDVIINDVTEANEQGARIFSFGIGGDVDRRLLTALSEQNHGMSIFFNPNEAHIDSVIAEFYRYISSPALVNPEVDFSEGFECDSIYPPELQDISAGKQLYLFGRYESFGDYDVLLTGQMMEGDTTMVFEAVPFPEEELTNEFVPRMWAKSVIDYWLRWMEINGERQNIIDKIIELSLRFGILTPYTEYEPPDEPPPGDVYDPEFVNVSASVSIAGGVEINWSVSGVTGPVRFNVYRSDRPDGGFVKLNPEPLTVCYYFDTEINARQFACYRIEMLTNEGSFWSEVIVIGEVPSEIALLGPAPNPFNSRAVVTFLLPVKNQVRLTLHNLQGQMVRTIYAGVRDAGVHVFSIDAADLPAGAYFVRLETVERTITRPLTILK